MAKRNILKLETNIPMVGTVAKAYPAEGKFGPQVALDGTWNGDPNGRVYGSERVAEQLQSLGILEPYEWEGEPRYRVLDTDTEVTLLKKEDGTKKIITVAVADGEEARTAPTTRVTGTPKIPAAPASTRDYWKRQTLTMRRALQAAAYALGFEEDVGIALETYPEVTERIAVSLYIQANRDGALVSE